MTQEAVTYSLIGCDDILDSKNPFRRIVFLPEGAEAADVLKRWDVRIHASVAASDPTLSGLFWYVHYVEQPPTVTATVMATAQILVLIEQGLTVFAISGPFKTEKEAQYDMDLHWESGE